MAARLCCCHRIRGVVLSEPVWQDAPISVPASLKDVIASLVGVDPAATRSVLVQDHQYIVVLVPARQITIPVVPDRAEPVLDALPTNHLPVDSDEEERITRGTAKAIELGADPEWIAARIERRRRMAARRDL